MQKISFNHLLIFFCLFWGPFLLAPSFAQQNFHDQPLAIETGNASVEFQIEIADDEQERSRGLMFRRSIAEKTGMLFKYDEPRIITMWMKNTYIPLDMLFFDEDGVIVSIAENAKPHSLKIISSGAQAQYVLEINAGLAKALGLQAGQVVRHPIIAKN